MFRIRPPWVAALILAAAPWFLYASAEPRDEGLTLLDLPERAEIRIPAVLADVLADVENAASALPGMDRKKAYLITLPLENHLKDVVLSANRTAVLHPRAMAWLIGREAAQGSSKSRISRLLVSHYQKGLFDSLSAVDPQGGATAEMAGGKR